MLIPRVELPTHRNIIHEARLDPLQFICAILTGPALVFASTSILAGTARACCQGMGEIAGMLARAVAKNVASKLGGLGKEEATMQWRFKEDVKEMAEKMKDLEALLHDADDQSRRGGSDGQVVGQWLTKFKSVAYDVEDVLDELEAAEVIKESEPKVH
jgi:hypothetical protein